MRFKPLALVPMLATFALVRCAPFSEAEHASDAGDGRADASVASDAGDAGATPPDSSVGDGGCPRLDGGPPITFLQAKANNAPGQSAVSVTLEAPVTAHGALILAFDYDVLSPITAVTDSQGNRFEKLVGPYDVEGWRSYLYAAFDTVGGADTVFVALEQPANSFFELRVHEYSGIASTNAFDTGSANGAKVAVINAKDALSTSVYVTCESELLFGFAIGGTLVAGSGFTTRSDFNADVTEDRILSTPGHYAVTATMTSGAQWAVLAAAFRGR